MKKKLWIIFSIVGLIIILGVGVTIKANKPNLVDYSKWLEDKYNVHCLDYANGCEDFTLKVQKDGQEKTLTMHNMHGGYDTGIFAMTRDVHYRSYGNSSYALDINVKGFYGDFKEKSEKSTLPN